jgi:hypothetical protein
MKNRGIASTDCCSLYKIGGVATLILLTYSLVTMIIMMVLGPPPEAIHEVFAMLQENEFVGLLRTEVI